MKKTHFVFLVVFVLISMNLFPLQKSYAVCTTFPNDLFPNPHMREQIDMPKIGFFTVGDDVPVTFTITNNNTETKYLKVSEEFRPYQYADKSNVEQYENDTVAVDPNSSVSFHNSFTAMFPDLWTLVVNAEGFDNWTREGIVNPCYQNFTKFYVHPSSDLYIKILAQSTNESASVAEKSLNEVKFQEIFLTISAVAAAFLAWFVYKQTGEIRKQTKLAHMPYLTPRFQIGDGGPVIGEIITLLIANAGHGPALKVKVQVVDPSDEPISKEFGFHALFPQDERSLGVNLKDHPDYKLKGYYYDLIGTRYEIENIEHHYPPSYE